MTAASSPADASAPLDWRAWRRDFPILDQEVNGHPLVYFDNAASTQKPRAVLDAMERYYTRDNANVHRGIHELSNRATAAYEAARRRAATFLNAASPSDIVFTRGTTEGLNLVARAWGDAFVREGDRVVLTQMEHHSDIVPWQLLARRTGARLDYIPVTGDDGALDLDDLDRRLDGAKVLAFTHISNSLGTVNPVEHLCARARAHGVVTVVDAAQSAGHRPLDVQAIGCDFLALSGHKLCGPTGVGVLYGRQALWEETPPYEGGGEMISAVDFHDSSWNEPPHKFEAGTPNVAGAVGLSAAFDYLDRVGRDAISRHDRDLAAYAYDRLSELEGVRLFGPKTGRAGVVSFLFEDIHTHDLATFADQKGLALRSGHHCCQPLMNRLGIEATARASFYFYNGPEEVDRMIEILQAVKRILA